MESNTQKVDFLPDETLEATFDTLMEEFESEKNWIELIGKLYIRWRD